MEFNKGAELDKQIYEEGDSTWGCKSGVLDVEDVQNFIKKIESDILDLSILEINKNLTISELVEKAIDKIRKRAGEKLSASTKNKSKDKIKCNNCNGDMEFKKNEDILIPVGDDKK